MPRAQTSATPIKPLILEKTAFGWRVKSPRLVTPLVWKLAPTPASLLRRPQPPAQVIRPTLRRLPASHHRVDPAFDPCSTRTQRKPRSQKKWKEATEETLQEELAAASQRLIRLTRSVLNLQNRLPITKPSSTRLTNIRKKRTELYKLCRTLRRTLSSEAESESGLGRESCGTSSHGWRPTSAPRYSESSSSSGGNCSDLQPEERSPPDSGRPAASNGPLRLDRELQSLTEQLQQDLQLPGLQVEVLDLSLPRTPREDSNQDAH